MPVIDMSKAPVRTGTIYPKPHDAKVAGRSSLRLGDLGGLTQFGVNVVILAPGARASMRHWHEEEDEFLIVLAGELTLIDDDGRHPMTPGDCAAFPAGDTNAHHMANLSDAEARFLVVGSKAAREVAHYPDEGLKVVLENGTASFFHEDGRPLDPEPA